MSTRISAAIAAASIALFAGGCATTSFDASTADGAVKASNAFGFDFYRQARKGRDNFVCSPAGAAIALTMVAAGARGEPQAEMLRTLHIEPENLPENLDKTYGSFAAILTALKELDGKDGLALNVASRLWIRKDLKPRPAYVSLLRDGFRAPLAEADFRAEREAVLSAINQWASDETHGRIPQIHAKLHPLTRMVLANAVYMMGGWQEPFDKNDSHDGKFTTMEEEETWVKMMSQVSRFRYAQVRGAKLVELPYKGGLSMIVILPSDVDGLERIEDRLASSYVDWIGALEYKEVDLELPPFTVVTELPLVGMLQATGIKRAFDPDHAEFSGMTVEERLFIGDAIQTAWIGADEKGTEYGAVTAAGWRVKDMYARDETPPPSPVIFHVDHPFLYLIRDVKSGAILFVGRMVKPS